MGNTLDVASAVLSGLPRRSAGARARPSKAPRRPLKLRSFESSPYLRRVRELLCELELPCLLRRACKVQVPYLVDPNTGTALFEWDAIRDYLFATYAR